MFTELENRLILQETIHKHPISIDFQLNSNIFSFNLLNFELNSKINQKLSHLKSSRLCMLKQRQVSQQYINVPD